MASTWQSRAGRLLPGVRGDRCRQRAGRRWGHRGGRRRSPGYRGPCSQYPNRRRAALPGAGPVRRPCGCSAMRPAFNPILSWSPSAESLGSELRRDLRRQADRRDALPAHPHPAPGRQRPSYLGRHGRQSGRPAHHRPSRDRVRGYRGDPGFRFRALGRQTGGDAAAPEASATAILRPGRFPGPMPPAWPPRRSSGATAQRARLVRTMFHVYRRCGNLHRSRSSSRTAPATGRPCCAS